MLRRSLASVALVAVMAAFPAAATVVVDQPGYPNGAGAQSAGIWRSFDDFTLAGNYTITTVSWTGWSTAAGTTFEIGFTTATPSFPYYPNTSLFSYQTATPTATVIPSAPWNSTYSVTLPVAVDLLAGTGYWISLYNPNAPYWAWGQGNGAATIGVLPPGIAATDMSGNMILQGLDLSFTLEGTPTPPPPAVPEPLSLALFGAGLGFIGLRRRWRR